MNLDVFGLQEVCPAQLEYLRGRFPEFEFVGEHREADRKSGEASPVAYRKSRFEAEKSGTFWLSETPDVPGVKGWGAACPRVCSYLILRERSSGRRLCFANTHTDHISAKAREKGMLLVIERMKRFGAGSPIVFVGDHNCKETDAPARAVSALLNDAMMVSETPPRGAWRTFNGWKWRETEPSAQEAMKKTVDARNSGKDVRIDYIYVSPDIRVLDMATIDEARPGTKLYPSDHFPLAATIALP
jgi:endonuclease/exonuclease/phosphatase family metal-dependent hydrolase